MKPLDVVVLYGSIPLLILGFVGTRRAMRAGAQWHAALPVFAMIGGWGFTAAWVLLGGDPVTGGWLGRLGLPVAAVLGGWLMTKYPSTEQ